MEEVKDVTHLVVSTSSSFCLPEVIATSLLTTMWPPSFKITQKIATSIVNNKHIYPLTYTQGMFSHTHLFLYNCPIFPYSRLGYSMLGQDPKANSWELLWQNFYKLDAFPVTQPTASKPWRKECFWLGTACCQCDAKIEQEHCDGCIVCLALRHQGSFPPVTITVLLTWRQHAATMLSW